MEKRDVELGMEKHSLWQNTQTCACQNKILRSIRRKFTSKTKRRGEPERDTEAFQRAQKPLVDYTQACGGFTAGLNSESESFRKDVLL